MLLELFAEKIATATWLRRFPALAGAITALLGIIAVIGWEAHWRWALQLLPGSAPMHFNTALCFILTGAALVLLTTRQQKFAPWLGGVAAVFCLLTLSQYIVGRDFGIDLLFCKPYFEVNRIHAGRMSPLTAVCFIAIGAGIILAGGKKKRALRLTGTGLLACVVLMIVSMALLGFAFDIQAASGWGAYARMAFNSALALFWLSGGLFLWSWRAAHAEQINFSRWVPVAGSATLIVMIIMVSAGSLAALKNSIFWRGHTYQVLNIAGEFVGSLTDTQRGMRGYLLSSSPAALELYERATNSAPRQFAQLAELTRDNPTQQKNITRLGADLEAVIGYSHELISRNDRAGLPAAIELEKTGRGLAVMNLARADLDTFTQEEQRLLVERDAAAAAHFNNTAGLLIFGSVVAVGLLVLANFLTSREVKRRRRAEEVQQERSMLFAHTVTLQNAILGSANYAIVSTSSTGTVTTFNATAERWLGYTAAEVVGQTTPAIWHDAGEVVARAKVLSLELGRDIEPGFEAFTAKAQLGQVDENEWTFIRKDGSRFPVTLSATALTDEAGQTTGFLGVIADITERKKIEAKLQQQQQELRLLFDYLPAFICYKDTKNGILRVNKRLAEPLGKTVAEIEGKSTEEIYPQDAAKFYADDLEVIQSGVPKLGIIESFQDRDNQPVWLQTDKMPVRDQGGNIIGLIAMCQDITERKRIEAALDESEMRYRSLFENMLEGYAYCRILYDEKKHPVDFVYLEVNSAFEPLTGLKNVIGKKLTEILPGILETSPDILETYNRVTLTGQPVSYERQMKPSGTWYSVSVYSHQKEHFVIVFDNITERKNAEEKIVHSLRDKEALLREIHHRVKNNMQVISSILQLQTNYIKDPFLLDIFKDCQGRIRTMALIHEKLYRSEGLGQIDFKEYLESLVGLLFRSLTSKGVVVRQELQIEPVTLSVDTAVPLGLIVNELLSNCLKHAFTGRTAGQVRMTLRKLESGRCQLAVQDDGIGLPPGFDPDKTSSLGVRLIKILSGQINGKMEFKSDAGSEFIITFDLKTH